MKNILNTLNIEDLNNFKLVKLEKEGILFRENDVCMHVGIIKTGEVKISSYSFDGNEIVYNNIKVGEMFGNNLLFSLNPIYRGNIIGSKTSEIYLIDKTSLLDLLSSNKEFLESFLEYEANLGLSLNSKIKYLSFNKIEERFLYYLFLHENEITYKSVKSLAEELNVQRESLSRMLTKLEKDKIIKREEHKIIKL
ncbi:MAG: Crp/Fnr family transcriptional regulator [Bacilli bacterium]|nr:Crp/Fnr family transcriptional regulator [Bacilli bacterium]MDY6430661.1 Crp/Fnr family transcriptional regulator [Bacilli bacterium]